MASQKKQGERVLPVRSTRKRRQLPDMLYYDENTDSYVMPEHKQESPNSKQTSQASSLTSEQVANLQVEHARELRVQELMESKLHHIRKQQRKQRYQRFQWMQDYQQWDKSEDQDQWNSDTETIGPAEQVSAFVDALRFSEQFMQIEQN
ncbi:Ino80 complex subunit Iec5 [Schizosaccharomyces cryophilus OY26]|uniref:Ino80 complex subunit Iec5 n=1 Tax=Schizosaccharomyces cryophilus (strain OY26 / ATCC MYA-4695 / CBS 11777 / NBRC 106824 / NRRL Y48691) TaxID=653667 RepID=S9W1Y5_SCHCR|nr:Ino80 complex subunit Iec5 [Schizosaccharomyces cryophilus OY26]EPY52045.1 Ino80 complex subunit Iec5 [Schizosaccharomyces cryophilus OY26]